MATAPTTQALRTGGNDAVCFTAGYKGAPFGAGVIHAWLAADRKPPEVAAGISMGALSAAAMQRSYQELEKHSDAIDREVSRWSWFRSYLNDLSDRPLSVIWDAIPDPIDFFADKPPVVDRSCPPPLRAAEAESRRNYYRLVKLGRWMASLPVSVRSVGRTLVAYVRVKEKYGAPRPLQAAQYFWFLSRVLLSLLRHFCLTPQWTLETALDSSTSPRPTWRQWRLRPLFGWLVWTAASVTGATLLYWALRLGALLFPLLPPVPSWPAWAMPWIGWISSRPLNLNGDWLQSPWLMWPAAVVGGATALLITASLFTKVRRRMLGALIAYLSRQLQISRGLVHEYRLRRRLFDLFRDDAHPEEEPLLEKSPMRVLIVAAPLQELRLPVWRGFFRRDPGPRILETPLSGQQVWAALGTSLITALRAALALPPLFPPVRVSSKESVKQWLCEKHAPKLPPQLDLVDGAAIRENPIPALFAWLKDGQGQSVAKKLESEGTHDARVHVVFNVPIEPATPKPGAELPERINIVRAALASVELARHRDTQLEVRQTNFISGLEHEILRVAPQAAAEPLRIFVDSIAPAEEIRFRNNLDPGRKEFLELAAAGCRRTLERLYQSTLQNLPATQKGVPCQSLLVSIAPGRQGFISGEAPGLREVCRHCTRHLRRATPAAAPAPFVTPPYGLRPGEELTAKFSHLRGDRPRIVFVASGGVFRGAFHIGVVGALHAARIRPDLIVGASVGALMGGALGAISVIDGPKASRLLAELASVFLQVDQRVALTRTIKNAAKQLGIRARNIHLSPAELRRRIRKGTRADPGYAALGAPPILLDAISELFFLPLGCTRRIAAEFVAGHVTGALKQFWHDVQKETLRHLDIEYALMGTSLLEPVARTLLGETFDISLKNDQPYHVNDQTKVSFFSTTSNLNDRRALLLGRDFLHPARSYDFVKAGLSSSAFPAVFSPRQEAEVVPGTGRTDVLFSDGGMFDNLPFFPAMEVLGEVQMQHRQRQPGMTAYDFLKLRFEQPDLFLAGALDAPARPREGETFEDLWSITSRAGTLKNNVKLDSFEVAAQFVGGQIERLIQNCNPQTQFQDPSFLDRIVNAGVMKIVPADNAHINPTFAFCASTGLDTKRIQLSIADGCYQTLRTIAGSQSPSARRAANLADKAVSVLTLQGRIPKIEPSQGKTQHGRCPFFKVSGSALSCPFARAQEDVPGSGDVRSIHNLCRKDPAHISPRPSD